MLDDMANYHLDVTTTITPNVIAWFDTAIHLLKE
jgi:hypothetical protein